jgi:hypothetical protein
VRSSARYPELARVRSQLQRITKGPASEPVVLPERELQDSDGSESYGLTKTIEMYTGQTTIVVFSDGCEPRAARGACSRAAGRTKALVDLGGQLTRGRRLDAGASMSERRTTRRCRS